MRPSRMAGFVAVLAVAAAASGSGARPEVDRVLGVLQERGDYEVARADLRARLVTAAHEGAKADGDDLLEIAFALRLVGQLERIDESRRPALLAYLREHDELARTLAFLVRLDAEDPEEVYAVLDRLRAARGEALDSYPALAAAICVVHDRRLRRRINENAAVAPDALEIFLYYAANENRMLFGVRNVPAELLVWVVDTTASIPEMTWALDRYAGDTEVGARFFDIGYDSDHYRAGAAKKVTVAGWNLPNILRHGGVCADQAYFAMTVGKAIGVPTAYAVGAGSEVRHAWVGFLQSRGRSAWWNFDMGRYEAYRGVRGQVVDPQVRTRIPDSSVSLLAELARVSARDRWIAAAYTDAAAALLESAEGAGTEAPVEPALALVEQGLRTSPGHVPGWMVVRSLAEDGRLTLAQKKRWAGVLDRLCAERYPDFYLAVLEPMIASIDDVAEQDALWERAMGLFARRHDLAAAVLTARAELWERAGETARAGRCHEEIINRYANAGPFILGALDAAQRILEQSGDERRVLQLYDRAFGRIRRPDDMAAPFYRQTNTAWACATPSAWSRWAWPRRRRRSAARSGPRADPAGPAADDEILRHFDEVLRDNDDELR